MLRTTYAIVGVAAATAIVCDADNLAMPRRAPPAVASGLADAVGNTPLIHLTSLTGGRILGKVCVHGASRCVDL